MSNYEYLLSDINKINGIGTKTAKLFRKKNINTIFDLLWNLPRETLIALKKKESLSDYEDERMLYIINKFQKFN